MSLQKLYDIEPSRKHWGLNKELPPTVDSLYGEITRGGVENLIFHLTSQFMNKDTVFYDLGSGLGRMVIHVAMMCPIKKSVGVEFIKSRWEHASSQVDKFEYRSLHPPEFINGNMLDLQFESPAVVYIDNTSPVLRKNSVEIYKKLPEGTIFLSRSLVAFHDLGFADRNKIASPTTYKADAAVYMLTKGSEQHV